MAEKSPKRRMLRAKRRSAFVSSAVGFARIINVIPTPQYSARADIERCPEVAQLDFTYRFEFHQPGKLQSAAFGMDQNFLEQTTGTLASISSFDDCWANLLSILGELGATAVNASKIEDKNSTFLWFRSNLSSDIVSSYIGEGHHEQDLIARSAVRTGNELVWSPQDGWIGPEDDSAGFSDFISDFGFKSVFSSNLEADPNSTRYSLTFCSDHTADVAFEAGNLRKIRTTCELFLPWFEWSKDTESSSYISLPQSRLTRRERDVLSFLAEGYQICQIAHLLGISDAMVSKHLSNARQRLEAKSSAQAVAKAIRANQLHL